MLWEEDAQNTATDSEEIDSFTDAEISSDADFSHAVFFGF